MGNGVRGGFRGGVEGVLEGDSDINFYNWLEIVKGL